MRRSIVLRQTIERFTFFYKNNGFAMNCEIAKLYASCLFNFCQIVKMFSFDEFGCFELTSMSYVF